jgi:hypothetical protein
VSYGSFQNFECSDLVFDDFEKIILEDKPLENEECSNLFEGSQEYEESADFLPLGSLVLWMSWL